MENITKQSETNVTNSDSVNGNITNNGLYYKAFDEAAAVISFVLFFAIVIPNSLVIYVLAFKQKKKKSRLNYFVLNLAIADFLVGVICVLGDGIQSTLYGAWYGGDVLCRLWRYGKTVCVVASNNLLIGMSVDRYLAIKYPLQSAKFCADRFILKTFVLGAWIISFISGSLFLYYSKGVNADSQSIGDCNLNLPEHWWKPYLIVVACIVYILPTLGITACYVGICIVIWKKWKSGLRLSEISSLTSRDKIHCGISPNTGLLPKAKVKSIKMTIVICFAFFICWTPYFVIMLLDVNNPNWTSDRRFFLPLSMLYPMNSACNPLIFILFNLKLFRFCREQFGEQSVESYEAVSTHVTTT